MKARLVTSIVAAACIASLAGCIDDEPMYSKTYDDYVVRANKGDIDAAFDALRFCTEDQGYHKDRRSEYSGPCAGVDFLGLHSIFQFGSAKQVDNAVAGLQKSDRAEVLVRIPYYRRLAEIRKAELAKAGGVSDEEPSSQGQAPLPRQAGSPE